MKKSRGNYEYSVTKGGFSSIFLILSHFFDNPRQSCYNIMVIYYTTWRNTMLQAADLKQELNLLQPRLEDLRSAIGYEALLNKKEELELKVSAPGYSRTSLLMVGLLLMVRLALLYCFVPTPLT